MSLARWLSLGAVGAVVAACGGGVSLGNTGSDLGPGTSSSSGGSGTLDGGPAGDAAPDCSAPGACGPALGLAAEKCSDGSIGGNTGRCILQPSGACGWEIRQCPPDAGTGACFDTSGTLDASYKKCTTAADCVVVDYQQDCCGTMHAAGVASSSAAAVKQCAADRSASLPKCACATGPTTADDGTTDASFTGAAPQVTCSAGVCETTYKPTPCGSTFCTAKQTCCSGQPFPTPTCSGDNSACPISQRKMKKDIRYLSEADKERLAGELDKFPLATYRYKTESAEDKEHLGFIIDDVAPSPAIAPSGERVDLYGYSTMTVATLQVQAREIAELKKQVEDLRRACGKPQKK